MTTKEQILEKKEEVLEKISHKIGQADYFRYETNHRGLASYLATLEERLEKMDKLMGSQINVNRALNASIEKLENEDNCNICGIFTPTPTECKHEWIKETDFKAHCKLCKAEKRFIRPEVKDWEIGYLTFDDVGTIMELCNAYNVKTTSQEISVSFVPKDATGKAWQELKEKMHRITKK